MVPPTTPEGVSGPDAAHDKTSGPPPVANSHRPFGAELAKVLPQACDGRLGDIHWFRTDWQRGGALTGYATWHETSGDGESGETRESGGGGGCPVVVKLPVPPAERAWLAHLDSVGGVAPKVYAHGDAVGGYDFAWVVMERLPHGPLSASWGGAAFDLMVEAAGRFYAAAESAPIEGKFSGRNWREILEHARDSAHRHNLADEQRWNKALKQADRKLNNWLTIWEDRPTDMWCHGDIHFANAMTRDPAPAGPALLFDYAMCHKGHWVEDVVYFEHLFWARRDRLEGRKLCSLVAKQRKKLGLAVHADWPKWADAQRALLAMGTPASLAHDGDPQHVQAALEVLEAAV